MQAVKKEITEYYLMDYFQEYFITGEKRKDWLNSVSVKFICCKRKSAGLDWESCYVYARLSDRSVV